MPNEFTLDPRLAADSIALHTWSLCLVRAMDDARFPWLILVPQRPGLCEIHELPATDRGLLIEEIARASALMQKLFNAEKINVAALGNQVPQLHIHVIARFDNDPAWPNPIWSLGPRRPMSGAERDQRLSILRGALGA